MDEGIGAKSPNVRLRVWVVKPDWNLPTFTGPNGNDRTGTCRGRRRPPVRRSFCISRLRAVGKRRAVFCWWHRCPGPLCNIAALDCDQASCPIAEVFITDWHNARDIPVSAGKFDVEDYTLYLVDFMKELGADLHVIAVCSACPAHSCGDCVAGPRTTQTHNHGR